MINLSPRRVRPKAVGRKLSQLGRGDPITLTVTDRSLFSALEPGARLRVGDSEEFEVVSVDSSTQVTVRRVRWWRLAWARVVERFWDATLTVEVWFWNTVARVDAYLRKHR